MVVAFFNALYEDAKEQCLDDLYKMARAGAFWSLEDKSSLFANLLKHGQNQPLPEGRPRRRCCRARE
jgi:hypothetical protein